MQRPMGVLIPSLYQRHHAFSYVYKKSRRTTYNEEHGSGRDCYSTRKCKDAEPRGGWAKTKIVNNSRTTDAPMRETYGCGASREIMLSADGTKGNKWREVEKEELMNRFQSSERGRAKTVQTPITMTIFATVSDSQGYGWDDNRRFVF